MLLSKIPVNNDIQTEYFIIIGMENYNVKFLTNNLLNFVAVTQDTKGKALCHELSSAG